MEPTITTRQVSFGLTALTKNGANQFFLDMTSHQVTTLSTKIQMLLLNYGDQLCDNGLLGPWSAVLLV